MTTKINISSDFFQGDIRAGLKRIRLRLLDLTNRNRLLNYRHTDKGSVRVINEVPDYLYEALRDNIELAFAPVPKPPRASEPLFDSIEDKPRNPPVKDYAERLGIKTSFELPMNSKESLEDITKDKVDRKIQTLHYPEPLESILSRLAANARLAIEETGTNMLYLVFGFIEWYEDDNSEKPHLAPLLLLPVALRRGDPDPRTKTYRYFIQYSGEDVLANISLQEKMRRDFNVEIPNLEEEETPESYFSKFAPVLKGQERWKIRRYITLTLLSFGKLLMYRDLDEENWPADGLVDHPRIKEMFHGIETSEVSFAQDYNLDEPDVEDSIPPLIEDADSSQHSALMDALSGKNLVIAGPPGTGKSQTITNFIAAALVQRKSVLFISEKLAALEVVRNRLDQAGLGLFCLELHSHKTRKREMLDDVENRIKQQGRLEDSRSLDQNLKILHNTKSELLRYLKIIHQRYGNLGLTVYEVVWAHQRARSKLNFDVHSIENLYLSNLANFSQVDLGRLKEIGAIYARNAKTVTWVRDDLTTETGSIKAHPLFAIKNENLTILDSLEVKEGLKSVLALATHIAALIDRLNRTVIDQSDSHGAPIENRTSHQIKQFTEAVASIDHDGGEIYGAILAHVPILDFREHLEQFLGKLKRCRGLRSKLTNIFDDVPDFSQETITSIHSAYSETTAFVQYASKISDLITLAERCEMLANEIEAGAKQIQAFSEKLQLAIPLSHRGLEILYKAFEGLNEAPWDVLYLRHSGLEMEQATIFLSSAQIEAEKIRKIRAELDRELYLHRLPGSEDIDRHIAACANAGFLGFLKRDFRTARKIYAGLSRSVKFSRKKMLESYQYISFYQNSVTQYCLKRQYNDICGPNFNGIDSPFDETTKVLRWLISLRSTMDQYGNIGEMTVKALWNSPEGRLKTLRSTDLAGTIHSVVIAAKEAITASNDLLPKHLQVGPLDDLFPLIERLRSVSFQLKAASVLCNSLLIPPSFQVNDLPELLRLVVEAQTLKSLIESDVLMREVLKEQFAGIATDTEVLDRTLGFYDKVKAASLPSAIERWLLVESAESRLEKLIAEGTELHNSLQRLEIALGQFGATTRLDESAWYGQDHDFMSSSIDDLIFKATRALDAIDHLSNWLDYLSARKRAVEYDLTGLVGIIEEDTIAAEHFDGALNFIVYNSLMVDIFKAQPELSRFTGLTLNQLRDSFKRLDREAIELFRIRAAHMLAKRYVPRGNGAGLVSTYTDLALLYKEISKQKRHIPIRQLIIRAGNALQALKPCFMMGPLSAAQYLAPGALTFDYVVMDEASQLKPEDALGSIARAHNVIIVGDRMQLPPTTFFDRLGEDEVDEDEENAAQNLTEAESILDVASALYRPSRLLKWHYRSQHPSLIAFSNKEFYDNELTIFPVPTNSSETLGVHFVYVKNGVYEKGKNIVEANRIVDAIFDHMRLHPKESLGVVTLNRTQLDVVEGIFEMRLKDEPQAQSWIAAREKSLEKFFIKNLENVQGDERDVILISVTYGPDAKGNIFQRFGPINSSVGHRRLNVLFTRAKQQVVLFSSMLHGDIQLLNTSSWGVRTLKSYLEYAETGKLQEIEFFGREPDSDFETEVSESLKTRGFETVAQVGVAGYFIDLAIKHPSKSGKFILAIECDGATYHSSKSARDRDRLRQTILERLGWKVHRIWSTDWFKNRSAEITKIIRLTEKILEQEN